MDLARAANARGDLREALRLLREALPLVQNPEFKVGVDDSIRSLEDAITRHEVWEAANAVWEAANAALKDAGAAYERGDSIRALALYQRALAIKPDCLDESEKLWVQGLKDSNALQQTMDTFAQTLQVAPASDELDFTTGDASVVDARNVPSGLPKSVEESLLHTLAGDRVRKGFQAITERDWPVAKAWFEDALNHNPGDPGLQRLVDLAQHTLQKPKPAEIATKASPEDAAALDRIFDDLVRQDLLQRQHASKQFVSEQEKLDRIFDDLVRQEILQGYGRTQYSKMEKAARVTPSASAIEYADTFMLIHDPASWRKHHPDWWKDVPEMVALRNREVIASSDGRGVQLPHPSDVELLFSPVPTPEERPAKPATSTSADDGPHN